MVGAVGAREVAFLLTLLGERVRHGFQPRKTVLQKQPRVSHRLLRGLGRLVTQPVSKAGQEIQDKLCGPVRHLLEDGPELGRAWSSKAMAEQEREAPEAWPPERRLCEHDRTFDCADGSTA